MSFKLEVADIFRHHGNAHRQRHKANLGRTERRVMGAIEVCRTAALGGHLERCDDCGHTRNAYNSCRNRHCPKCQGLARAEWLADRQAELLPVPYFHVVFTVPAQVAEITFQNKEVVYDILFGAAHEALFAIASDPKHLGTISVLHSWGQNLHYHPHIHCIVPGGGLSSDGKAWIACRKGFFLSVRVLSRIFRRLFLTKLQAAFADGKLQFFNNLADPEVFAQHLARPRTIDWVVYAKRPFGGPEQVLAYLGRYTHRVAIANSRLLSLEDGHVRFRWRDYRHHNKNKTMTLLADAFIRRFLLHTLPEGFHRIRHYGFLANGHRAAKLALIRKILAVEPLAPTPIATDYRERTKQLTGHDLDICPCCGGHLKAIGILPRPSPTTPQRATRHDDRSLHSEYHSYSSRVGPVASARSLAPLRTGSCPATSVQPEPLRHPRYRFFGIFPHLTWPYLSAPVFQTARHVSADTIPIAAPPLSAI